MVGSPNQVKFHLKSITLIHNDSILNQEIVFFFFFFSFIFLSRSCGTRVFGDSQNEVSMGILGQIMGVKTLDTFLVATARGVLDNNHNHHNDNDHDISVTFS